MRWEDIDDCEGCGKKSPRDSAISRLARKVERSSAIARLTRVVVPPYIRINPKTGKRENVDGYTYNRADGKSGTVVGKPPKGAISVAPTDRPKGAEPAPATPRLKVNTPTPAARQAVKQVKEGASFKKGNEPKGASAPEKTYTPVKNVPNIPEVALKVKGGSGTKEDPFVTDDVETAAALIGPKGNNSFVQLEQERKVSTLLDRVKALVDDARAKGDEAPLYDLCKVTVPGTNLFCVDNKDIPRVDMPQLTSDHPVPGSPADKMERDGIGEVNLTELYVKHLAEDLGINVNKENVDPSFLRATQNELNGGKVAGIAESIAKGGYDQTKPIFVTRDDYVVDGHHRWAGAIGAEYKQGEDMTISVRRIDLDIMSVYYDAVEWTKKMGIPPEGAGEVSQKVGGAPPKPGKSKK